MSKNPENLYIFDGFSKEVISFFLLMSQVQYVKTGDVIMREKDPSNGCAYYITKGKVKVVRSWKEIARLGTGAFFGEIALITDEARTATIEAVDDTELQIFLKDDFLTLLEQSTHSDEMKEEIRRRITENATK